MKKRKLTVFALLLLAFAQLRAQSLYLCSNDTKIYRVDLSDCSYELLTYLLIVNITDIAFHPNGNLYGISDSGHLFEIDTLGGTTTDIFDFTGGQSYNSLVTSSDGTFYTTGNKGELWSFHLNTGMATYHGEIGYVASGDLTFYKGEMYMSTIDDEIVKVDINTPANSQVVLSQNKGSVMYGMATIAENCEESYTYVIFNNPQEIYKVDIDDATLEYACSFDFLVSGAASKHEFLASSSFTLNSIQLFPPACGQSNGSISISASVTGGGLLEYSVDGLHFQHSFWFSDLSAGLYEVWIRDQQGCFLVEEVFLSSEDGPVIDEIMIVQPSCGKSNGRVEILASSPNGPLNYSIDGITFHSSNVFDQLKEGQLVIYVEDVNGCRAGELLTLGLQIPPAIYGVYPNPTTCGLNNGRVGIDIQNGLPPFLYALDGGSFTSVAVLNNLAPGSHDLVILDQNGCVDSTSFFIGSSQLLTIEEVEVHHTTCGLDNGSIGIWAKGGGGHLSYQIDNHYLGTTNWLDGLGAGTYRIIIKDEAGCTLEEEQEILPSETLLIQNIITTPDWCSDDSGSIRVEMAEEEESLRYSVDGLYFQKENEFRHLASNTYWVQVKNGQGCKSSQKVEVEERPILELTNLEFEPAKCEEGNGSVVVHIAGGTPPYLFSLENTLSQPDSAFYDLSIGEYRIEVSDEKGCHWESTISLSGTHCPVYLPNAFSPNGDGVNDSFQVYTKNGVPATVRNYVIYDRWGGLLYQASGFSIHHTGDQWWDGTSGGKVLDPGIYVYLIEIEHPDGEIEQLKGDIAIIP